MKVIPVASPHAVAPPQHGQSSAQAARERALNILTTKPAAAQSPVLDQNNIGVEELGAIAPKKQDEEQQQRQDASTVIEGADSEATEVTEEVAKPADPAISRQFAQLARQEKAFRAKTRAQEMAIKAREAALVERESQLTQQAPDLSKYIPRDRIKAETLAVLAEEGVSYDELTNQLLNQQAIPPQISAQMRMLEAQIAELKAANEEGKKSGAQAQQAQYDAAVNQIKTDAKRLVFTDPNFETVKATNSVNDVVELITQTYEKDGILLSVEDAAQQVEDYLVEEATKIAQISKIQKRLQKNATASGASNATNQAQKQQNAQQAQKQPQMKTLTNATASQRKPTARERAIAAMEGKVIG